LAAGTRPTSLQGRIYGVSQEQGTLNPVGARGYFLHFFG